MSKRKFLIVPALFGVTAVAVTLGIHAQDSDPISRVDPVRDAIADMLKQVDPCLVRIGPRADVCGSSDTGAGVAGFSKQTNGVQGVGEAVGVIGISNRPAGKGVVAKNSGSGVALEVDADSEGQPAAVINNNHAAGDHLFAGPANAPVLVVKHNGDVFVRGQQIGLKGEKGDRGERGPQGPQGLRGERGPAAPALFSVCGQTTTCGCNNVVGVTSAEHWR